MKAILSGGVIVETDYFESSARDAGRAWLVMCGTQWHVLLPRCCDGVPRLCVARPVTARAEVDGWRWRLELDGWHLPFPVSQIIGKRPRLPDVGTQCRRSLTLYATRVRRGSGQSFFGAFDEGVSVYAQCPLFLVR